MANDANGIKRELYAEINSDLSTFANRFTQELRATTPIRTGQARQGWKNVYKPGAMKNGRSFPIAKNEVPYIGVLDSNKTSRQAPMGIVEPALRKTTRK
jgi:hypothetical protein